MFALSYPCFLEFHFLDFLNVECKGKYTYRVAKTLLYNTNFYALLIFIIIHWWSACPLDEGGQVGLLNKYNHLLDFPQIISIPRTQTREIQVTMDVAMKYVRALRVPEAELVGAFLQSLTSDPTGM